ncbi:MAG: flagellar hook-basal body complex protein FliE [Sinobacterium sp.]|nr:flagellar hook-basal body complex protein FliE [Sinobacterium sp.]
MSSSIDSVLSQIRAASQVNSGLKVGFDTIAQPGSIRPNSDVGGVNAQPEAFSNILKQGIESVNDHQMSAADMSSKFELGQSDKTLAEVMVQIQKADVSFKAMTEVRNKLVEAYREVMQMSV